MENHRNKKLILIIDDEADLAVVLAQLIAGAGFGVVVASDGVDGLEKAKSLRPDAVILDVAMPKLDGWGFCERFRSDPSFKRTPVIILTAWLSDDLTRKANAAGANGIMLKPYDEKKLIGRLRELCESASHNLAGGKR